MKLQTPVTDAQCKVGISYKDKITMLGSCFSDNIGRQLTDLGFDVCVNPFGTLYNPVSIFRSVERLIAGTRFTLDDCVKIGAGDERFCSFSHHTSFAGKTEEEFLERFEGLTRALVGCPYVCGFCYTQLYDIEQEVNGLYTYERKPKFDMQKIKEIVSAKR